MMMSIPSNYKAYELNMHIHVNQYLSLDDFDHDISFFQSFLAMKNNLHDLY